MAERPRDEDRVKFPFDTIESEETRAPETQPNIFTDNTSHFGQMDEGSRGASVSSRTSSNPSSETEAEKREREKGEFTLVMLDIINSTRSLSDSFNQRTQEALGIMSRNSAIFKTNTEIRSAIMNIADAKATPEQQKEMEALSRRCADLEKECEEARSRIEELTIEQQRELVETEEALALAKETGNYIPYFKELLDDRNIARAIVREEMGYEKNVHEYREKTNLFAEKFLEIEGLTPEERQIGEALKNNTNELESLDNVITGGIEDIMKMEEEHLKALQVARQMTAEGRMDETTLKQFEELSLQSQKASRELFEINARNSAEKREELEHARSTALNESVRLEESINKAEAALKETEKALLRAEKLQEHLKKNPPVEEKSGVFSLFTGKRLSDGMETIGILNPFNKTDFERYTKTAEGNVVFKNKDGEYVYFENNDPNSPKGAQPVSITEKIAILEQQIYDEKIIGNNGPIVDLMGFGEALGYEKGDGLKQSFSTENVDQTLTDLKDSIRTLTEQQTTDKQNLRNAQSQISFLNESIEAQNNTLSQITAFSDKYDHLKGLVNLASTALASISPITGNAVQMVCKIVDGVANCKPYHAAADENDPERPLQSAHALRINGQFGKAAGTLYSESAIPTPDNEHENQREHSTDEHHHEPDQRFQLGMGSP